MPIDNTITKRLNDWLALKNRTTEDVISGATLLLQLNRNRQLFQTVMTSPKRFESTVEYELKKFAHIRQRGQTLEDVKNEASELLGELKPAVADESNEDNKAGNDKELPAHGGKRADHDLLPSNIKAIWTENAIRWKKIKALYNTCLGIKQPCDLAESLHALKEEWYKYKSEFARYDGYIAPNPEETANNDVLPADNAKAITNARSYLSKAVKNGRLLNKKKASLADNADEKTIMDYNSSLQSAQERVQLLLDNGEKIGDDLRAKLTEAGVVFAEEQPSENSDSTDDKTVDDEQGQDSW